MVVHQWNFVKNNWMYKKHQFFGGYPYFPAFNEGCLVEE